MAINRNYVLNKMKGRVMSPDEFNFDMLQAPSLYSLLTVDDIRMINKYATSIRWAGRPIERMQAIDQILVNRGFRKLTGGTNRVVYKFLELDTIVLKVATDAVGVNDNPREYYNQQFLKPFVTKVFEVSQCGTVGLFERVTAITSREEFLSVAPFIFDLINNWFIGEYVCDDIGTEFFLNWGIRNGFGPVLLDFPYVYKLDGNKLYCNRPNDDGTICNSVIDYDDGFNHLRCTKCGAEYKALELKKAIESHSIISKGGRTKMKVGFKYGDNVVVSSKDTEDFMDTNPKLVPNKKDRKKPSKVGSLKVTAKSGNKTIIKNEAGNKNDDEKPESTLKVKPITHEVEEPEKVETNDNPETTEEAKVESENKDDTSKEENNTEMPSCIMFDGIITNSAELDGDENTKIKCIAIADPSDGSFAKFNFGEDTCHIILATIDGMLVSELSIVKKEQLVQLQEAIEIYKTEIEMLRAELAKFDEDTEKENVAETEDDEEEVKVDNKGRKRDSKGRFSKEEPEEEMKFDTSSPLLDHNESEEGDSEIPVGVSAPKTNRSKRYDPNFYEQANKGSKSKK